PKAAVVASPHNGTTEITPSALMLSEQTVSTRLEIRAAQRLSPTISLFLRLSCRTGARSGRIVDEAGNRATELRRRRNRPGRVDDHDKVRTCRNRKGVGRAPKRCSQTHHSAIAKIVQAQVCWIVGVQICRTFNVASATKRSIDRDSEARFSSAIICEVERLEALRPREPTAGTSLSTASTWLTIAPESIGLGRIIRVKHVCGNCLVRPARARWYGNMDSLAAIRKGEIQIKFNLRSAAEISGRLDLEWRQIRASRIDRHVRIIRAALYDGHTRSCCRQRCRDSRRICAAVVFQFDIQVFAIIAVDDAITANRRAVLLEI